MAAAAAAAQQAARYGDELPHGARVAVAGRSTRHQPLPRDWEKLAGDMVRLMMYAVLVRSPMCVSCQMRMHRAESVRI
jgi:hypothetical protein